MLSSKYRTILLKTSVTELWVSSHSCTPTKSLYYTIVLWYTGCVQEVQEIQLHIDDMKALHTAYNQKTILLMIYWLPE